MTDAARSVRQRWTPFRPYAHTLGNSFGLIAMMLDALGIVALAVGVSLAYHLAVYGGPGDVKIYANVGALTSLFYLFPQLAQKKYELNEIVSDPSAFRRIFRIWNFAFFCVLVVGFVAKLTDVYSRGAIIIFYFTGLLGLVIIRAAVMKLVRRGFRNGWLASTRLMLLGTASKIRDFRNELNPNRFGLHIADVEVLPERVEGESGSAYDHRLNTFIERALEKVRLLQIDDIVLLLPWSDTKAIRACTEAFMTVPASTTLGPEQVLERFHNAGICRIGPVAGLKLVPTPLNTAELAAKRAMDIVLAAAGLIVLSPVFLVVAVLIRLESAGPVFFFQHRHGFNQAPFRIIKFRTMITQEDGTVMRQATADDPRVTPVGRLLRRWNIDELPQLLNVLKGDMSIVGPRPHALVHNHEFERRIALYARRHNVKPGITGWAQVNGYRGQTDTEEKMRARIEHDLYYIDNWSIWFDLQIILLTLLSRRAYRNAC